MNGSSPADCGRVFPILLLLLFSHHAQGQSVQGHILDDVDDTPIRAADVILLAGAEGDRIVGSTASDSAGWFAFDSRREGRFRLRAERLGYHAVTSPPFDLVESDTLQVELRMAVDIILLAPLTIVSDRMPLVTSIRLQTGGFLERREQYGVEGVGLGTFLLPEDWEHRNPRTVAQLLQGVKGVRPSGDRVFLRSITSFDPRGCLPSYYVDGNHVRLRSDDRIEDIVPVVFITAVEVYHGIARPARFMDMERHPCGAIVIWTG